MDRVVLAPCFRGHYTHLVEIDEYANLYVMDEGNKNSKRSALVEWLAQVIVAATTALEPCGYDTEKQRQLMEEVKKENKGQNFWWGLSRYDAEEYRRVEDAEERAEMGAEERAKRLTDIAKIVEEKAKDIDRCHMEGSYETDKPWEEIVLWLRKARECVDSLLVAPGGQNIDMTKPQPCTKFEDAVTVKWVAKLLEETNEVIQETPEYRTLFENGYSREYPDRAKAAKDRIALELTDVIHVCVSWLNAMGYDEDERGELHRRVNEKNRERGYC